MGSVRSYFYLHCCGAHSLRSKGSRAVELATHSSDGAFHGHLRRRSVLALDSAGARACVHALDWQCSSGGGPGHLCGGMPHWAHVVVGSVWFSSTAFRPGFGSSKLAGNFLAVLLVADDCSAAGNFFPAKWPWTRPVAGDHAGDVRGLEAVAILWHCGAVVYK